MNTLNKFLGTTRWRTLFGTLRRESLNSPLKTISPIIVVGCFLTALIPCGVTLFDSLCYEKPTALPTIFWGLAAILAIIARPRLGFGAGEGKNWKASLSLTHTAVALGCIPAVLVILFSPTLLTERHDVLTQAVRAAPGPGTSPAGFLETALLIAAIAFWAAVTEEAVFRGLLVSAVRRCSIFSRQWPRDLLAAVLSSGLFGFAHYWTWGPAAALALTGLGFGFVIAYISTQEKLFPVILYHFCFDLLSISASVFLI